MILIFFTQKEGKLMIQCKYLTASCSTTILYKNIFRCDSKGGSGNNIKTKFK